MYILLAIGLVASASAKDLIVGHEGGMRIFQQNITASPAIWQQMRNLTVNASDYEVITRVVVLDHREDKNGEAVIVEGGEGFKNVTIELKSPAVFRGYDFEVQVYAKPEDGVQRPAQIDQHQVPQEANVFDRQLPKEVIEGINKGAVTPVPTTSTTEQDKIQHPAVVSKDDSQNVRPSRDTQVQEEQKLTPIDIQKTDDKQVSEDTTDGMSRGLVTPVPTSSTTEVNNQDKVQHPAVSNKDVQNVRPSRDSQVEKEQKPLAPVDVQKTQEQKPDDSQKPNLGKNNNDGQDQTDDWDALIDQIFAEKNSTEAPAITNKPKEANKPDIQGINQESLGDQFTLDVNGGYESQDFLPQTPNTKDLKDFKQTEKPQAVDQQVKGVPLPYLNH